ncbi:MAG: hypothetical protein HY018_12295 [Hydrogenophilales bacterium]|nr:hypothetical protein [Hydrogenophilales bacterium]
MKMKIGLMLLLCAAGVAWGQDTEPGAAAASDAAQAPDSNQVQPRTDVRDSHDRYMGKQRQGRDMRRCLKLKTNAAIIRCAEPGRKP